MSFYLEVFLICVFSHLLLKVKSIHFQAKKMYWSVNIRHIKLFQINPQPTSQNVPTPIFAFLNHITFTAFEEIYTLRGLIVSPNKIQWSPNHWYNGCKLTWKQGLCRYHQMKTSSLGWALTQCVQCPYKKWKD